MWIADTAAHETLDRRLPTSPQIVSRSVAWSVLRSSVIVIPMVMLTLAGGDGRNILRKASHPRTVRLNQDQPQSRRRWVGDRLREVGYETEYLEAVAPGRGNVFADWPAPTRSRGALLVHGHLDVVPAEPSDWSVHPFSGAVRTATCGAAARST